MKRLITSLLVGSALSSAAFADNITTAPTTIPAPVTATSYTAGALLLGNGSSALNVLADTTSGQCLQSNGSGANPVWGSCSTGGGSPGGSSGQLQYNNSGSFGGLSTFTVGSAGNLTNSAPASSSNGPTEAINCRLEHLRGSALGFRNLTNYIARCLLEAGGFRPQLHRRL